MTASSSSSVGIALSLVLACGALALAQQNAGPVKGTRTVISTPYSRQVAPTASEIAAMKVRAAKERVATISDSKIGQRSIAFSTCSGTAVMGAPAYELKGMGDGKPVAFSLAEIEELRADMVEQDRTLFTVTRFPVTTAGALIADRPSYTELRARALARATVWVSTTNTNGTACLVEQGAEPGKWVMFAHLGRLATNTVVTFDYAWKTTADAPIWWAVPSVVLDTAYPYRREVPLKS